MLTLEEARHRILERVIRADAREAVPLAQARGRFLAGPHVARVDNPAFDNSAMDGYACVCAEAAAHGHVLPVAGEARAGAPPARLATGTCMRIFTGAPLPVGADTVEIQENVRIDSVPGPGEGWLAHFPKGLVPDQHIRRRGEDFRAGELLLDRGRRLSSWDIALLAAAGLPEAEVWCRPRVRVVACGDELIPPGQPLAPGQIHESNRHATLALLADLGIDGEDGGIVPDDADALRAVLRDASGCDFVITSGGASVGDHDLVRNVFAEFGEIDFWKVRIKPGKPVAFGRIGAHTHFFTLPGNPVSSLVTFKLFVEPALHAWHHAVWQLPLLPARAVSAFMHRPGREEYLRARVRLTPQGLTAEVLKGQGSHRLGPLRHTNALLRVSADSAGFAAGESVEVVPLREFVET